MKNARIEKGAKANHLAYLGDARVGAGANIGAGTITCNYDGFDKHHTDIGAGAFIGSNTALVAPVKVGDGVYVGAGSVITKDDREGRARGDARRAEGSSRLGGEIPRPEEGREGREGKGQIACAALSESRARATWRRSSWMRCKRLEYRGYDSAGIATLVDGAHRAPPLAGQARQARRGAARPAAAPAAPASATRAGRRTARRRRSTRIRTPPRASPSCTTASSRISASCATS